MKPVNFITIIVLLCVFSCSSSKYTPTQTDMDALETLVREKTLHIESNWAYPLTTVALQQVLNSGILPPGSSGGSISLVGNTNFLNITGDSISSYLPYFGERQMLVTYGGGDSSIQFKGIAENYKTVKNKNNSYTITFEARSNSEKFNVTITLTPSLKSDIFLSSGSRNAIRYSGWVKRSEPSQ